MSRWQLSDELKTKYLPVVQEFIDRLENIDEDAEDELEIDLSDTGLSPFTLVELLKGLGYEEGDTDTNGWQMDFWTPMNKSGFRSVCVNGTGITFELKLTERT